MSEPSAGTDGRAYLRLVLLGALVGVPAALLAACFLALVHELEHVLWNDLTEALGHTSPPLYLVVGMPVSGPRSWRRPVRFSPATGDPGRSKGSECTSPLPRPLPAWRSRHSGRCPLELFSGRRRP